MGRGSGSRAGLNEKLWAIQVPGRGRTNLSESGAPGLRRAPACTRHWTGWEGFSWVLTLISGQNLQGGALASIFPQADKWAMRNQNSRSLLLGGSSWVRDGSCEDPSACCVTRCWSAHLPLHLERSAVVVVSYSTDRVVRVFLTGFEYLVTSA